jgi:hypothetical protein
MLEFARSKFRSRSALLATTSTGGQVNPEIRFFARRRDLAELLNCLNDQECQGVLLLGASGMGKTALLLMVEQEWRKQGRAAFLVGLRDLYRPGDLGAYVLDAIAASSVAGIGTIPRTLRTSAGAPSLHEAAVIARSAGARMLSPVLLFDDLDASVDPRQIASAVEELSLALRDWKLVVSAQPGATVEMRRFARFRVIQLRGLDEEDVAAVLGQYVPGLSQDEISLVARGTQGNPALLNAFGHQLLESRSLTTSTDIPSSLESAIERTVNEVISTAPDPVKMGELLEHIALAGGRERMTVLSAKLQVSQEKGPTSPSHSTRKWTACPGPI